MRGNMNLRASISAALVAILWCGPSAKLHAQARNASAPSLQTLLDSAVATTLQQFAGQKLQSNQLAVTLVDLRDTQHPVQASYRGDIQIYPASVVKLFYLVAAHRWME